jgi:spore coat-associated protein N
MKRHLTGAAIALALLGAAGGSLYAAGAFSAKAGAAQTTMVAGTVRIGATPAGTLLTMSQMLPGDVVTRPVTVVNSGTLPLRYAVTSTTTEARFAAQLDMVVKTGVTNCTNAGFGADGAAVYGPGDFGTPAGQRVIGDVATGAQPGDRDVAPGVTEVLCVQVSLPATSDNTYQGLTTTSDLRFVAEQL